MSSVSAGSSGRVLPHGVIGTGATDSGFSEGSSSKSRTATRERHPARINKAHDLMSAAMVATARNEGSSLGIESITILPRGSVISRDPKRRAADSGDDRRARKRRRALTGPGADEGVVGAQFKLVAGKARDADEDEDEDDEVYLEITSQRSPSGSGRARTMVYDRRVPIEVEMATRRRAPPPPARVPSPARSQESPRQYAPLPPWLGHQLALAAPFPRAPGPRRHTQSAEQSRAPVPDAHSFVPPTSQPRHYNPYLLDTPPGHRSPIPYPSPLPFSTSGRVSPTPSVPYAPSESLYESQMSQVGLIEYQRRFSTEVDRLPLHASPPRYSQPMPQRPHVPSPRHFGYEDPSVGYSPPINYSPLLSNHYAPPPPPARDFHAPQSADSPRAFLAREDWQQSAHPPEARSRSPSMETCYPPNQQSFPPFNEPGSDEMALMWDSRSRESVPEAQSLEPTPRDLYAERLVASASESFPTPPPAPVLPFRTPRPLQFVPAQPQQLEGFHFEPNPPFVPARRLKTPLPFVPQHHSPAPRTLVRSPSPALPPTPLSIPPFRPRPRSFESFAPPARARTPHRSRPASAPPLLPGAREQPPPALPTLYEEEPSPSPEGRNVPRFEDERRPTCVVGAWASQEGAGEYDWATPAGTRWLSAAGEMLGGERQQWQEQEDLEPAAAEDDDRSAFSIWEDPTDPVQEV